MEGPYKIFIAEGTRQGESSSKTKATSAATDAVAIEKVRHAKLEIDWTGSEVRQFYEGLLSSESHTERTNTVVSPECVETVSAKTVPDMICSKDYQPNDLYRAVITNDLNQVLQIASVSPALINTSDQYGWSPLMMAACEGHVEICCLLMELGADTTLKDGKGNTAESLAEIKGHADVVALLQSVIVVEDSDDDGDDNVEPFDCDVCKERITESSRRRHDASTLHQFNLSKTSDRQQVPAYGIPSSNKGFQLMVKQGWDKNKGLGPDQRGRQYPIKTVLRKDRQGLGMKQKTARVSHFGPNDHAAVQYQEGPKVKTRRDLQRDKRRNQRLERSLRRELS